MGFGADLTAACAIEPGAPRLTWYGPGGARIELSGAVLRQWVAKATNALVEAAGCDPGMRCAVGATDHWLGSVAAAALWCAGARLIDHPGANVLVAEEPPDGTRSDVLVGLTRDPLGAPLIADRPWWDVDLVAEARAAADQPHHDAPATPHAPAAPAPGVATALGARLLVTPAQLAADHYALLGRWLAGDTFVVIADPAADVARIAGIENAVTLGDTDPR